jgi:1-acyl-sn-glycerol-3-phosphate acyltransferase
MSTTDSSSRPPRSPFAVEGSPGPVFPQSRLARVLLGWFGWKLRFSDLPAWQGVIVVYPHTSNWDFPLGVLAKWALGLQVRYWAKDSLFRVPVLGAFMRHIGGIPVDRSAAHGVVGQTVQEMRDAHRAGRLCWLVVAPEGTRKAVPGWKSGFYRVAVGANVPIGIAAFDYGKREIRLHDYFLPCGDESQDLQHLARLLEGVRGYHPEQAAPIRLR